MKPVLILAGTPRVVVGIARCLHSHGLQVEVAQSFSSPEIIRSRSVAKVHRLPVQSFVAPAFGDCLLRLVSDRGYDTVVPTTDEALIGVAGVYEELSKFVYPGCPPPATLSSVLDKRITLDAARSCGLDVPRQYSFFTREELEAAKADLRFPLLAKPARKKTELGFAVQRFDCYDDLEQTFAKDAEFGTSNLLQEFCPGYGVGIEVLLWDGEVHATFRHRRLKELPAAGGVSILCEAHTPQPELLELSVRLLRQIGWRGVAMVEFRHDPDSGRSALMEINGRYWGSLPLSLNAGVEFPWHEWQLAHGQQPLANFPFTPGFRTLWRTGDLMRFNSLVNARNVGKRVNLWREFFLLMRDFFSFTPDAVFRWNDPAAGPTEFYARFLKKKLARVASFLPSSWRQEFSIARQYGIGVAIQHWKLRSSPRASGDKIRERLAHAQSILFVCSGNIMRSPFSEHYLRSKVGNSGGIRVSSAGLFAVEGRAADPSALRASRELGISLDSHRSTALTAESMKHNDVIFVMDFINEAVLLSRFPKASQKVLLLSECSAGSSRDEIADPYGKGIDIVQSCYQQICRSLDDLAALLASANPIPSKGDC